MNLDLLKCQYFEDMPIAFCVIEVLQNKESEPKDYILRYANKALADFVKQQREEMIGKSFQDAFHGMDEKWMKMYRTTAFDGIPQRIRKYNTAFGKFMYISTYQIQYGFCACMVEEIADYQDTLMGCMNAEGFKLRAEQILRDNPHETFVFWYCDIKQFKYVNETFGYEEGDYILRTIGKHLLEDLDEGEVLGRISGDTFAIMAHFSNEEASKKRFRDSIREAIESYMKKWKQFYTIEIASGVYVCRPEDREQIHVSKYLDYANSARKQAKKEKGSQIEFFSKEIWEKEKRAVEISRHLNQAMADGEIQPWFQPQYDYKQGKIIGAEVLARWTHPAYGRIFPDEFIHVLEETGQISELDAFIWESACQCMRGWLDAGYEIPLSINLSRKDVLGHRLSEQLSALTEKYHLKREMLHLEITESAYMNNPDELMEIVEELNHAGFHVEMDDFGNGYSSLNMLKNVPVKTIKLDLRFLTDVEQNSKAGNIISSVIRMAHGMEMAVIAEGVETQQQADFLKNLGCNLMQGYYFARPLPQAEFEQICMSESEKLTAATFDRVNVENIQEFLTANNNSSFIFNRCVGAGSILEYNGREIEIVLANDKFYEMRGGLSDKVDVNAEKSGRLFSKEDTEIIKHTIERAITQTESRCKVYMKPTEMWIEVRYTLISKGCSHAFVFCQMENVTQEYILQKEMDKIRTEMQTMLDLIPGGVFKYEAEGTQQFEYISNGVPRLLGYGSVEELRHKFQNSFMQMVCEKDRERVFQEIEEQIKVDGTDYSEYRIEGADGRLIWVHDRGRLVTDENGKQWFYAVITDADQIKKLEIEHQWRQEQFQALAQMPGVITYDYNPQTDLLNLEITDQNGHLRQIITEEFLGRIFEHDWIAPESAAAHKAAYQEAMSRKMTGYVDFWGRFEGETYRCYRSYYTSVVDKSGRVYRIVGRADEIDEDVQKVINLQNKAERDSLTGLLNYEYAVKNMEYNLKTFRCGTLLMIDIDNFKNINDIYGHLVGNEMLKRVADVLTAAFRQSDIIGRFGGDEFIVFLPNVADPEWVKNRAKVLVEQISSIKVSEEMYITASVGVAIDKDGTLSLDQVLKKADDAMYHVKGSGKNLFEVAKEGTQ